MNIFGVHADPAYALVFLHNPFRDKVLIFYVVCPLRVLINYDKPKMSIQYSIDKVMFM